MERLMQMPLKYRFLHDRALRGKSPKDAIAVFCIQCCGWEIEEVFLCTDLECPLYLYRPKTKVIRKSTQRTQNYTKYKKTDQLLFNYG
jgi:hypothetical protein